jgi:acyl-CoA thioester hydrolase
MSLVPHRFAVTVHDEDTDLSGFVYHANYLKFIERARSDWVRALGIDQGAMRAAGLVFAVRRIEAEFLAPARLDDRLEVTTAIAGRTAARLVVTQAVARDGAAPFRARVTLVCMTLDAQPRRLPAALAAALAAAG